MLCLQEDEISILDQDVATINEEICVAEEEAKQAREEVAKVESSIAAIQERINQQIGEVESLNVSGASGGGGEGGSTFSVACDSSLKFNSGLHVQFPVLLNPSRVTGIALICTYIMCVCACTHCAAAVVLSCRL